MQSLEIIVSFSYFVNLCHYIIPPFCAEKGTDPDDIYMQTIKAAQFSEEDFFGTAINKDMVNIKKKRAPRLSNSCTVTNPFLKFYFSGIEKCCQEKKEELIT